MKLIESEWITLSESFSQESKSMKSGQNGEDVASKSINQHEAEKRKKFELRECILSIILFTISTPFGQLISFLFVSFACSKKWKEKKRKKRLCLSNVFAISI